MNVAYGVLGRAGIPGRGIWVGRAGFAADGEGVAWCFWHGIYRFGIPMSTVGSRMNTASPKIDISESWCRYVLRSFQESLEQYGQLTSIMQPRVSCGVYGRRK